ncbi:MAG TPA: hypothetical protein HPP77_02430 [Candidatus Hydrogenedentes bacterium]|nr:hypothetical protein [Candidatus Hydrogenedentota bacterium]HIJ74105.1 hypothetical protein [Candidatus Hydrogenedentota bacterium]
MARKAPRSQEKIVDIEIVAKALAKAVSEGDFVNFCLLFHPASPAREDSPERFETDKYAYLLPDDALEADPRFRESLAVVRRVETRAYIAAELRANRPARLPSALLLPLADNALRLGKYTSAAQAYELLRIRGRMQDELFRQADAALDGHDIAGGVRGYVAATGLAYNYAAFPEPLPAVADFERRALMLHGNYPETPEDCIGLQETGALLRTALSYLLLDPAAAARLEPRPEDIRVAFLRELVAKRDPDWPAFAVRFREAVAMADEFGDRPAGEGAPEGESTGTLAAEIEQQLRADPTRIMAHLVGRELAHAEWWQYLKELAYKHPPAPLFVARQTVGDVEILAPRARPDSPVTRTLGLSWQAGLDA